MRAVQVCCGRFMTLVAVMIGAMWTDCSSQETTSAMEIVSTPISPTPTPVTNDMTTSSMDLTMSTVHPVQSSQMTPTVQSSEMTPLSSGASTDAQAITSVTPSIASSVTPSIASSVTPSIASSETPSIASSETPAIVSSETPSIVSSVTPSIVSSVTPSIVSSVTPSIASSETPSIVSSETFPSTTPSMVSSETFPSVTPYMVSASKTFIPAIPSMVSSGTPSMVSSETSSSGTPSMVSSETSSMVSSGTPSMTPSMVSSETSLMVSFAISTSTSELSRTDSLSTSLVSSSILSSIELSLTVQSLTVGTFSVFVTSSMLSETSPSPSEIRPSPSMSMTGTTSSTTAAATSPLSAVYQAVIIVGGLVVLVLLIILLILTCYCVRGCLRKRSRNAYLSASEDQKRTQLNIIELQSFTPLEKNPQDCLVSLPLSTSSQIGEDVFTESSLPHLSPISYSSQLMSEFTKLYESPMAEKPQLPLPLHGPRGASQPSLSTSYLAKFPDASTSLAEPTRMALSLGMSMEELPSRLSSKSTTPPHSTHTSTELKQQNSTGKMPLLGVEGKTSSSPEGKSSSSPDANGKMPSTEEEGKQSSLKGENVSKMRPTSPAPSRDPVPIEGEEMVPTPGSPRTERPPNVPATQQAVPKVRSLSGLTVIPNLSADGMSDKEQSTPTRDNIVSPFPTTSTPIPASKEQAPPPATAAATKKVTGKKLNLEALTSVKLPSAPQSAVQQGKERSVSFAEPSKDTTRVARKSTISNSSHDSKLSDSLTSQGSKSEDKPKTRRLSQLEKLTSLDYIRASLRARRKKVSFSVANRKPLDAKKLDTKQPKESETIYNRHATSGRNSPPPMFSPSGEAYEEEDVFIQEPLGAGHFTRRHSGHDAILAYPQLSQPVYMPAYEGGFVQLSQTYYPPLSQGIPYPYAPNHLQPDPFVYHDDLTPEDNYPEERYPKPGYSELDQHGRHSRDWSPDTAYTDTTSHKRHEEVEGGLLLAQRKPKRVFSPGGNPTNTRYPEGSKLPSCDLDDPFRSPAKLLNSDNTQSDSTELSNGTKPKPKPRVSWKPSVEYHSRTPDPDVDDDDNGHHL